MDAIPNDVKDILGQLTGAQQVVLRKYIGTLRADIKELKEEILGHKDPHPHDNAHFHGEHRCTADHDHGDHHGDHHNPKKEEKGKEEAHPHSHAHKEAVHQEHGSHAHKSHDHSEPHQPHDHGHAHKSHGHEGGEHGKKLEPEAPHHEHHSGRGEDGKKLEPVSAEEKTHGGHDHGHSHAHKEAEDHSNHSHGHAHKEESDNMPAWKKKALEAGNSDPMAAPFGGTWTTEASMSATDDKMEE